MRFFQVLAGVIVLGCIATAAPQFRVTKVGAGEAWGFADDGAIGANRYGEGAGILYQGQFTSMYDALGGRSIAYRPTISAHDTWSANFANDGGVSVYKGVVRYVDPGTGTGVSYTNGNGDYVGFETKPYDANNHYQPSRSFIVKNGVRTYLTDYSAPNLGAAFNYDLSPTCLSDSGQVCGTRSQYPLGSGSSEGGWVRSPSDSAVSLRSSISPFRVNDSGDVIGQLGGQASDSYYGVRLLKAGQPDQQVIDISFSGNSHDPDMNNLDQVVYAYDTRPNMYWEKGTSYALDSLVINPGVIPTSGTNLSWDTPHINNLGQIVTSIAADGKNWDVYRFDPVPEPSSVLALGAGALVLLRRRRSR